MLFPRHMPQWENIVIEQLYRKILWADAYPLLLAPGLSVLAARRVLA
jgi:hypothetical protein